MLTWTALLAFAFSAWYTHRRVKPLEARIAALEAKQH